MMPTTSDARIRANRENAQKSSGPKTPEGKVASRANALKHGLTGTGIVSPAEDLIRIAAVAGNLRDRYQPTSEVGLAMTDHAAMLLVRLGRSGKHELAMITNQVAAAVYDFGQARRDWADDLFDGLEANPAAIDELQRFPEGIDRLIEAWSSLAATDEWSGDDLATVVLLAEPGLDDLAALRAKLPDVILRLESARAAIDTRPIEQARQQAANLALFSTAPEAILARKYDAATERAYHKAIRSLENDAPHQVFDVPEIPQTPTPDESLGSFLPEARRPAKSQPRPEAVAAPVDPEPQVDRSKRPDPKKLRSAMDRKRR